MTHATAAGLGLSAILATSALASQVFKFAGAAYLLWLGFKAWSNVRNEPQAAPSLATPAVAARDRDREVYFRSVLTGLFNPKAALFLLAFLSQFVHPERGLVSLQFMVLGAILSVIGFGHSLVLACVIARLGGRLSTGARITRIRQRATGTLFVGLGLLLAFEHRS